MRPRIAVTLSGSTLKRNLVAREQYLEAIRRAGAEPIAIFPNDPAPEEFDGLCLSGGGDIDPARYGEVNTRSDEIDQERDALELAILERALARDIPVLGICRGLQLINVHLGGSLEQHHLGHAPKYPPEGPVADDPAGADAVHHDVTAEPGSKLAAACGDDAFVVNSSHHQVVTSDRLASDLLATAHVGELVEALESTAYRWVVAVQWHPERTAQVGAAATRIFDAFVAEVKRTPVAA